LTATVSPDNATTKTVTWTTSNPAVASVSTGGTVTIHAAGSATITATTTSGNRTATCAITGASGLSTATPGWGSSIGTASFVSGTIWTVGGRRWSDYVVLSSCATKTTYNPGGSGDYLADGRNNPTWRGTLLSWAAVIRYQDQLCPNNWRVPTLSEFTALNSALALLSTPTGQSAQVLHWGAQLSGYCGTTGTISSQGDAGRCWSATQESETRAYNVTFSTTTSTTSPQTKTFGYPLRCIEQN
jgi:uncharacterized protein (TIGR02145 family)